MSSQAFFWLNVGGGLLLVLIFLIGRKRITAPSRLNLRKGQGPGKGLTKSGGKEVHFRSRTFEDSGDAEMKNLNLMFMYNGHHFDAYEVLGAPAGASLDVVQKYFHQALARGMSDREFLEAAFTAIKMDRKG
ncbi:MAG: hypothetical protein COT73_02205 [Bdellovibrio sp. CG10_big_fil_rev_8_21_14_0_10_47_8]|nr:MAG: hypothetical protein COT73_02205 [Bdellovibrio sp. CG10_big_fil_rev_8_21_14_0_10_47_8]